MEHPNHPGIEPTDSELASVMASVAQQVKRGRKRKLSPEQVKAAELSEMWEAYHKSNTCRQLSADIKAARKMWRDWQEIVETDDEDFVNEKLAELQTMGNTAHSRFVQLVTREA
jgi:hypothetical protein